MYSLCIALILHFSFLVIFHGPLRDSLRNFDHTLNKLDLLWEKKPKTNRKKRTTEYVELTWVKCFLLLLFFDSGNSFTVEREYREAKQSYVLVYYPFTAKGYKSHFKILPERRDFCNKPDLWYCYVIFWAWFSNFEVHI